VLIRGQNIFDPNTFAEVQRVAEAAAGIKGVRRVISLPGIKGTVGISKEWTLEEFSEIIRPVDLFLRNLVSEDQRSTIITLVLEDQAPNDGVLKALRQIISHAPKDLTAYPIGMPLVSEALAKYTAQDLKRLPPITLAIIVIILILLFRNAACIFLPLMTVILSQVWTFGLMAWLGIPLSMLTMIVPVFLIAVGTAYCLHLCSEYLQASQNASSPGQAVRLTFTRLTFPTVLAVFTTIIGIGSLFINKIPAIREFALFSCFGMASLLVIFLSAFPAALVLFPLPSAGGGSRNAMDRVFHRFIETVVSINLKHQRTSFAIILVAVIFCLLGIFRIQVETNPVEYFRKGAPVSRHFHDIYRDLSGSFPINVLLKGNTEYFFEDLGHVREIVRLQDFLEGLPGVDKTITFADYLKLVNYALNRYDPKYYALPREAFELRTLINNFKTMLGDDMLRRFMSADFSVANVLMLTHISGSRKFLETKEKIIGKVIQDFPDSLSCEVTGFGVVISESSHLLTSGQVKSLSLTLALIFFIMVLLFLSSKVGFIAILPNIFPIIINFGVMGWLGVPLSMATSLIASIAIGLAVDDTIHYLFRYNREFKKDLDKDRALADTIRSVGRPILFTTLVIGLGFSILLFSHFKPTALFGLMMVITMFSALVGDLILLPSLMLHTELVTAWDLLKWIPTMGGVSPGMAHEIRQPLNAIKVGNDFLRMMVRRGQQITGDQLQSVVQEIGTQVERASAIIDRLDAFGQGTALEREALDINRPIRETIAMLENELLLESITLQLDLREGLPAIKGSNQQMAQVFFNVMINAREAIHAKLEGDPEGGESTIIIKTFAEKNRVIATVTDRGIGIPPHIRDRIFEPFFSTKGTGKGKGLGLAISNQIVKAHAGDIRVYSREGEGTTFTLSFPMDL
jgi:predicted RND superfamily exporter protein